MAYSKQQQKRQSFADRSGQFLQGVRHCQIKGTDHKVPFSCFFKELIWLAYQLYRRNCFHFCSNGWTDVKPSQPIHFVYFRVQCLDQSFLICTSLTYKIACHHFQYAEYTTILLSCCPTNLAEFTENLNTTLTALWSLLAKWTVFAAFVLSV